MARYFNDEFVKWAYRIEPGTDADPSVETLRKWDKEMFDTYGRHFRELMSTHGIDWTARNRSIIAMLTYASPSSGKTRVRRACEYWAHVMGKGVRGSADRHDWPDP